MAGFKDLIEPMTLGNMRANGMRSLDVAQHDICDDNRKRFQHQPECCRT
jgi:hypothetical protein